LPPTVRAIQDDLTARFFTVAAAALVTAGCGGGDEVTRAEWARDADAICAEYERKYNALGTAEELPELARLLDKAVALLDGEREELARLEPPADDEERVEEMLAALEDAAAAGRQARAAARRGDEEAVGVAIGESDSAAAQARHIARDLEARTCAEP
jgi:hypothetical protein